MPPIVTVPSRKYFGVFNQVKSEMYTSIISASLFGVVKCLNASKQLERATKTLESIVGSESVLLQLEKNCKCFLYGSVLKNVELLRYVSKQLEMITEDIEGYLYNLYEPTILKQREIEVLKFYHNVYKDALYKITILSLMKLSETNRSFAILYDDLELFTHQIADTSFHTEKTLQTIQIIERILKKTDAEISQLKCILSLQVIEKLLHISKQFNQIIIKLEKNTSTQNDFKVATVTKSASECLEATYKQGNYLLLSTKRKSVLKLFEVSKFIENVTQEVEAHLRFNPSDKNFSFYNEILLSAIVFVQSLQHLSKQCESITEALNEKTTYKQGEGGLQNNALLSKTRNQLFSGLSKLQGVNEIKTKLMTNISEFVSSKSKKTIGFIRNLTYSIVLFGVNALLKTSKNLETVSEELELFVEEVFYKKTESDQHSHLLLLLSDKKAIIRKALITQNLWFVSQAVGLSKHMEKITTATEIKVAQMCQNEKKILENIKTYSYIKIISSSLSGVILLQSYLENINKNLEEYLQKKTSFKTTKTLGYKKRRRDKNSNDENEDLVGRSYKMMNASKELERLLNELEAFVVESPKINKSEEASIFSKLKQDVNTIEKLSKSALNVLLLKIELASLFVLHKASESFEIVTRNLEVIAENFVKTDITKNILQTVTKSKTTVYKNAVILLSWNINLLVNISRLNQYVTADLELFTHEICYPSVRRRNISFCTKALKKSTNQMHKLLVSIKQNQKKIVHSYQTSINKTKQFLKVRNEELFIELPRKLYPKLVYFSLNNIQLLSVVLKELQIIISDFEQKLKQQNIIMPQKHYQSYKKLFTNAIYDYGTNRVNLLSSWCSNEVVEFLKMVEMCIEKTRKFEPWNITVLNEVNRIHIEFAKKLQCCFSGPSFTLEFQLEVNSSMSCYKTEREVCKS